MFEFFIQKFNKFLIHFLYSIYILVVYYIAFNTKKSMTESTPKSCFATGFFKEEYSLEERKNTSAHIRKKYPDRIPVIVMKAKKSQIPDLEKHKYLIPNDMTSGAFIYEIRKHIKIAPEQAIFCFVGKGVLPPSAIAMEDLHGRYADEDGFLYITITGENVFGYRFF